MVMLIKVLPRLISLYYTIVTLLTLITVADLFISPRTQALGSTGILEILALAGWALNLTVGPYATVQLWRLKSSGCWSAIVLAGYSALYYAVAFFLKQPEFTISYLIFDVILVLILLSIARTSYFIHE